MSISTNIAPNMHKGLEYLLSVQKSDGSWCDYDLPVGASDQWVTAYTALGVLQASRVLKVDAAIHAARAAAAFLLNSQVYEAGWGYNSTTGVDADSTAQTMRLMRALEIDISARNHSCLLQHFQENGGASTYLDQTAWGIAHPDVTATAGLALSHEQFAQQQKSLQHYCELSYIPGIGWPTYWWKNHLYATWHMLMLYQRMNVDLPSDLHSIAVHIESAFDLAWALGILHALHSDPTVITQPLSTLCQLQLSDGAWPGAGNLRVTDPDCFQPWQAPAGEYYTDQRHTITTASVLMVLSTIASAGINPKASSI